MISQVTTIMKSHNSAAGYFIWHVCATTEHVSTWHHTLVQQRLWFVHLIMLIYNYVVQVGTLGPDFTKQMSVNYVQMQIHLLDHIFR